MFEQGVRDHRLDALLEGELGELDDVHAARVGGPELTGSLHREPGLPNSSGAHQGHEPGLSEQPDEVPALLGAPNERIERREDVVRHVLGRRQRREMATARVELVQVLGPVHVLQAMPAEVDPRVVGIQRPARIAGNDLPSVRGGCDPRRHVDRRADIVVVDDECLARMRAHPDPELERPTMVTDRSLGVDRRAGRGGCRLEGTAESVTFRPEHDAAGILDRRAR